jgi:hypothetical protein
MNAFTDLMSLKAATGAVSLPCLSCGQIVHQDAAKQHAATCKVGTEKKESK